MSMFETRRPPLPVAIPARGIMTLIACAIVIAGLYFGRDLLVPIVLAVLLAFVLAPVVRVLRRFRLPRVPAVLISVLLAFVHLYTLFMMVPIFNSMARIDRSLIEAARDGGASGWQTLVHVILPLCKPGIVIGSIFVLTIVMGDFVTVGIMGGQQIASVGKVIQVQMSYLQFPIAAANAVVLLAVVLMMIWGLTKLVDVRREL